MNLSVSSRYTYHCPLARLNLVRWMVGCIAAALWLRAGLVHRPHDEMVWTLFAAVVVTQAFGTTSSGMLMLRPRVGIIGRLTDWYAVVSSVMTWVIGVAAVIWNGITLLQAALLLIAIGTGLFWLGLIHFGLQPIHLGAIERE